MLDTESERKKISLAPVKTGVFYFVPAKCRILSQ